MCSAGKISNQNDELMSSTKQIGGDRQRDPGFFTFFPTDKNVKTETDIKDTIDETPEIDNLSPAKAAKLQINHPPKIKTKRDVNFKIKPVMSDAKDKDVPSTADTNAERLKIP